MQTVVLSSESDGLSDSEDEMKKLRGNLGKAVAVSRRKLGAGEVKKNELMKLGRRTTGKGTRSQKDVTNNTPKVKPLIINP